MSELYVSLLPLHPRSREARRDAADPYELHRTLSRAFGEDHTTARSLFRLEEIRNQLSVLVQSRIEPDWSLLPEGYLATPARVLPAWTPTFRAGQKFAFRLRANPTVKRDNRRLPLVAERERLTWLVRKAEAGGFSLPLFATQDGELLPRVTLTGEDTVTTHACRGQGVILNAVRYDGVLNVTDPTTFAETVRNGIGSAKGFGFGLLSLAPVK